MELSLISIALCTYNGALYLKEQLNSILSQDYQNIEIVISDDKSTDGTYELLQSYQLKYPQIKLQQNTMNLGFNKNFEQTIFRCKGAYIAIADQDDIWVSNKLSILLTAIKNDLLIYHDSVYINEQGQPTGKKIFDVHRFVKGQCTSYLLYNNCVSGHACFFKNSLLNYITSFPKEIYYDWWIAYTAACMGQIGYVTQPLVKHRRHMQSSTTKDSKTGKSQRIKNLRLFYSHHLTPESTKALILKLLDGYHQLNTQGYSFKLLCLLIGHSSAIFFTRKKSLFSQIKFILTESLTSR